MLIHTFTHFYILLRAFTCFYPLCKLSSSQDLVVGLVFWRQDKHKAFEFAILSYLSCVKITPEF